MKMSYQNSSKFTVAKVSQIFKVDRDTVTKWAYEFSSYLGADANPPKGNAREFKLEDIRIMAYIYTEWEDSPDIECIKIGLNNNYQYEHPHIDDLITSLTPLFSEPPEDLDEIWKHGVIYSGLASLVDMLTLARSYKLAGDRLIGAALDNEEAVDLQYSIMFNYRHSIELYLKVITGKYERSHNLLSLYNNLKKQLKADYNANPSEYFENVILGFNKYDPNGTAFRYGEESNNHEVFIDFRLLKKMMGWLCDSFQNILYRKGVTY